MLAAFTKGCAASAATVPRGPACGVCGTREGLDIVKVLVMVEPEKRDALRERLSQSLGEEYYVTSSSDWLVEVMPAGENKGTRGDLLFPNTFISLQARIAAAGDQLNDLPMLEAAGGKFAVSETAWKH